MVPPGWISHTSAQCREISVGSGEINLINENEINNDVPNENYSTLWTYRE